MKVSTILRARILEAAAAPLILLVAVGAWAQMGSVRGKAVDQEGQPVGGAEITIEFVGGVTREIKTTSNDNGDFIQVGFRTGDYRVTIRKDGYEPVAKDVRIASGDPTGLGRMVLKRLAEGMISSEVAAELSEELQGYFDTGLAEIEKEDYQSALSSFQKIVELSPESAGAHFNLGFVYQKLGDNEKALPHYEKAVELRSDHYEALVELGNLYNLTQQYAEAMTVLERAMEMEPTDIPPVYNYGAVAMNATDMAKAQQAFEKVLELDPDHAAAHYQLGIVFMNQAANDEAKGHLEKYLELEPEGPHAASAKGIVDYLNKN